MAQHILIVGTGFAGMWSALAARRLIELHSHLTGDGIEVTVVAPEPKLVIRPRLYEENAADMYAPLDELYIATGVRFVRGTVDVIRTEDCEIEMVDSIGVRSTLPYDRLILAAGSHLVRPDIPGLRKHAFSIDQLHEAAELEAHIRRLATFPPSPARNTVVICGGGFTGIEAAAEFPHRLRSILGLDVKVRVVVVERADVIGPELGVNPRPTITMALNKLGVEAKLGAAVASVDAGGVVTAAGERIDALTVVWTAGMEATALTKQVQGERDRLGRLHVDGNLQVPSCRGVFAAGDVAYAATDNVGNHALMSCQHAVRLGRAAGHNAAADLLNIEGRPYSQVDYGTCLDLGSWGSVVCSGWDRQVHISGASAKMVKQFINSTAISPPRPHRDEAFAAADPATEPISLRGLL